MATDDFVRARPDTMIDLCHRLAVLPRRMPWVKVESPLALAFAHRDRAGWMRTPPREPQSTGRWGGWTKPIGAQKHLH